MDYRKLNIMGGLRISPTFSLAETAEKIGAALGGVRFAKDSPGKYDEFPSFSAEAAGLSFALLGIPDLSAQVTPINDFEFQIGMSFRTGESTETCDASGYYLRLLRSRTDLSVVDL